jgi:hypothetical protein
MGMFLDACLQMVSLQFDLLCCTTTKQTASHLINYSWFSQQTLPWWQAEVQICFAFLHAQCSVSHYPLQLHLKTPCPPVIDSFLAANRSAITGKVFQFLNIQCNIIAIPTHSS